MSQATGTPGAAGFRLGPMSLANLLDATIALYRQNFALFLGIAAVLAVPEAILNLTLDLTGANSPLTFSDNRRFGGNVHLNFHPGGTAALAGSSVLGLIFGLIIAGALSRAISDRYLNRSTSVGQAYSSIGVGQFVVLIVASILSGIAIASPFIAWAILLVIAVVAGAGTTLTGILFVLLFIVAAVLAVYIWVHLVLVAQTVVIERQGIVGSLRRSWSVVRGSGWRVLGIVLVVTIMVGVASAILGSVVGLVLSSAGSPASATVSRLITILFQPFEYGAFTLLYYDLRIRNEGFDLEHLANQLAPPQA